MSHKVKEEISLGHTDDLGDTAQGYKGSAKSKKPKEGLVIAPSHVVVAHCFVLVTLMCYKLLT